MAALRFRILGPLEVVASDGRVLHLVRRKQRALLALLLTESGKVVSVDRLVELLWPDDPPAQATNSLQSYVSSLRRLLEPDRSPRSPAAILRTQPPGYLLDVNRNDIDAGEFELLVAEAESRSSAGALEEARQVLARGLALWRGPALAEFAGEPFGRAEAARLEELRLVATERRLEADLALGEHIRCLPELESLVATHPLRERLWGMLMLASYRAGRQGDALRAFQAARRVLADELGLEPGRALRDLEADILAQADVLELRREDRRDNAACATGQRTFIPTPEGQLVGRKDEFAFLEAALQRARQGSGGIILVHGEPGIGKTRLAEELAQGARARGMDVAWGRCYEGLAAPPVWPWVQVLRALLPTSAAAARELLGADAASLAQVVPELKDLVPDAGLQSLAPVDPDVARFRLYEGLADTLARLAERAPLLVVIDDLHWADVPTLELIAFLGTHMRQQRCLILATYRPTELEPAHPLHGTKAALARSGGFDDLAVPALTAREVGDLVSDRLGEMASGDLVATIQERSEGNPFFVVELVRFLRDPEKRRVPTDEVPGRVRDVIRERLRHLPEGTQSLLQLAAVTGRDFDVRVLERAAGRTAEETVDMLDAAQLHGLVAESSDRAGTLRFSHALVQEALYLDLTGLRRAALHGRVAQALEDVDPSGEDHLTELAEHWYEAAAVAGEERGFRYALRAAEAAQGALAFEAAEAHLHRAVALAQRAPDPAQRVRWELEAQLRLAAAISTSKGWAAPRAGTIWARAVELSRQAGALDQLLSALWGLAVYASMKGDMGRGAIVATAAQIGTVARETGDPTFVMIEEYCVGYVALHGGDPHVAAGKLAASAAMAADIDADHLIRVLHLHVGVLAHANAALAWALRGAEGDARTGVRRALTLVSTLDHPFTSAVGVVNAGSVGAVLGDAEFTRSRASDAMGVSRHSGFRHYEGIAVLLLGWSLAARGDVEAGLETAEDGMAIIRSCGLVLQTSLFWGLLADVRRLAGRIDEAVEAAEEGLRVVEATGERFWEAELCRLRGELARERWTESDSQAERWLRRAATVARRQQAHLLIARADASLAGHAALRNRP